MTQPIKIILLFLPKFILRRKQELCPLNHHKSKLTLVHLWILWSQLKQLFHREKLQEKLCNLESQNLKYRHLVQRPKMTYSLSQQHKLPLLLKKNPSKLLLPTTLWQKTSWSKSKRRSLLHSTWTEKSRNLTWRALYSWLWTILTRTSQQLSSISIRLRVVHSDLILKSTSRCGTSINKYVQQIQKQALQLAWEWTLWGTSSARKMSLIYLSLLISSTLRRETKKLSVCKWSWTQKVPSTTTLTDSVLW